MACGVCGSIIYKRFDNCEIGQEIHKTYGENNREEYGKKLLEYCMERIEYETN